MHKSTGAHKAQTVSRSMSRAVAEALEERLAFATFTVLNDSDSGAGSLRQAITDSVAVGSADTIAFNSSFFATPRTISLLTELPEIAAGGGALTITGPGAALLTIRRDPGAAAFGLLRADPVTLNISGLTLTGGNRVEGGALILRSATITSGIATFDSVVVTGNSTTLGPGGAIAVGQDNFLMIRNSTFSNNTAPAEGGAIAFFGNGSLVVENSTFSGNSTITGVAASGDAGGGAIQFSYEASTSPPPGFTPGALVIRNSTFNNNTTVKNGGAIALHRFDGNLVVQNCTITGNTTAWSGGGISINTSDFAAVGNIAIHNSTITGNTANANAPLGVGGGGGIGRVGAGAGTTTLHSSVVSGNTSPNGPDIFNSTTTNVNHSAVGSNAGFVLSGSSGNNLAFGAALSLGALGNNGGPTQTQAVLTGSPLINAGSNPAGLTTDQRGTGFVRVQGASADIGAFEVQPQTFVVVNANDSGTGSLREAIISANVGAADDTITFDTLGVFSTPRTISLLTALPQVILSGGALTILGPGATNLTVRRDPGALSNFRILDTQNNNLSISGMTMTGGNPTGFGGAIQSNVSGALLALDGVVVTGNSSTQGGAGIALRGFLSLMNSTVSGNTAGGFGAGVDFLGGNASLVVENSTISGNSTGAGSTGGGVYFSGAPSASPPVGFVPSTLVVRNSTIANNTATGAGGGVAVVVFSGTLLVENSTVSGNAAGSPGGGLARLGGTGTITIRNSVVSGNTNAGAPDISSPGTVNVNFSAVGSATGFTASGTSGNNLAPGTNLMLGALANYGGPTQSVRPQSGSPLISAGSNALIPAGLTTDQRGPGFARVFGINVDIGAVEAQPLVVTNNADSGTGSLRQVITDANAFPGADEVTFLQSFFNLPRTISLLSALPTISDSISIDGPGLFFLTIRRDPSAVTAFRIFNSTASELELSDMTISGGNPNGSGGGLLVAGTAPVVSLDTMIISGNSATVGGGGVFVSANGASLTITRSTLSGNSSTAGGGVTMGVGGSLLIDSCTISANTTTVANSGGGVRFVGTVGAGGFVVRNSTIAGNSSGFNGGGIGFGTGAVGTMLVQNCTIVGNTVSGTGNGGGIGVNSGATSTVTVQNSIISGNTETGSGTAPDVFSVGTFNANFSAIGSLTGVTLSGSSGNNLAPGTNLLLGPLTVANGGSMETISPMHGSPLVNRGSNALIPVGTIHDQRGGPFLRIQGGAVDIGALELQVDLTAPTVLSSQFQFELPPQSLRFTFSDNVGFGLDVGDLIVVNTTTSQTIPSASIAFAYTQPGGINTATFTFPGVAGGTLPDGNYTATLVASSIYDFTGNPLDGNGDGVGGDDFQDTFFFLNGDATRDRSVNGADFNILLTNFGTSGKTFTQGNFSYDVAGNVDGADFNILASQFGKTLPGSEGRNTGLPGGMGSGSSGIFGDGRIGDGRLGDDDDADLF